VEQQLLTAMRLNPGASLAVLGAALAASRSAVVSRLHKLARRGEVEKGRDGHWRLKTKEAEPRPMEALPSI
jgi:DNA-binding IclR family transcriptional regulator